ncbi:Uncharacterised protein [Mycobacteroides abscessus subsp. abscessus]|nr:Uncharacterised protein [Mycobacteroides abscessus subsp. abscessus]
MLHPSPGVVSWLLRFGRRVAATEQLPHMIAGSGCRRHRRGVRGGGRHYRQGRAHSSENNRSQHL